MTTPARGDVYLCDGSTYRVCGRVLDFLHEDWELLRVSMSDAHLSSLAADHTRDLQANQTGLSWDEYLARHMATPLRVELAWFTLRAQLEARS